MYFLLSSATKSNKYKKKSSLDLYKYFSNILKYVWTFETPLNLLRINQEVYAAVNLKVADTFGTLSPHWD